MNSLIPSRETATHRYARTHNGKIKVLPKKKTSTLRETEHRAHFNFK